MAPVEFSPGKGRDSDKLTALSKAIPSKPTPNRKSSQTKTPPAQNQKAFTNY